ncbi:pleckstrin homology domain containing, family K member 1 (predicted), isoform CRA_a [Rattus norvegicus]|nr:pleckstrin homology domain containing, family K member 1 (predicted), isoform CRA_a [Rattus norvegicus]EDL97316.1 pleckstrin homology domain containing, family K member 1 (predicted), isoform CRA_a [Rattus norvegicus]|eukprot:NP_001101095.1 rhotekin-2 [Rattus norvegicus]
MAEDAFAGFLNEQQTGKGLVGWRRLYCALRGGKLRCFYGPEEIEAKVEPTLVIPVDKETRIQAMEKDSKKMHCFSVLTTAAGRAVSHIFAADGLGDFQEWMDAFRQHRFDLSIDSPVKLESVTDIIQKKIGETNGQFLIGREEESTTPPWASVFDGSHEMVIQKKVLSPAGKPAPDGKRKKRRAPLPPMDQPPFSVKTQGSMGQSKDSEAQVGVSGAPSSDRRLSPPTHHLQKPVAAPRKLLPTRKSSSEDSGPTDAKTSLDGKPVPAPRQKSIRDILDPRSWLQAQV